LANLVQNLSSGECLTPFSGSSLGPEVRKIHLNFGKMDPVGSFCRKGLLCAALSNNAGLFPQLEARQSIPARGIYWPPVRYAGGRSNCQRANARAEYSGVAESSSARFIPT
jgi:hypothetical protein